MKFLKQLFGEACSHRFTWPRVDSYGRHYQICLSCGTAYEYDWRKMRRTSRIPQEALSVNEENRYSSNLHS